MEDGQNMPNNTKKRTQEVELLADLPDAGTLLSFI